MPLLNAGVESKSDTIATDQDTLDILNVETPEEKEAEKETEKEDKEDKEDKDTEESEEDTESEEDEETEEEDKIELKDEEEEPEQKLVTPFRKKDILKKYPDVFKDFPYLEKAYYAEREYRELIGSPEDAKELVTKAQTLDNFETQLLTGNTEEVLKAVKDHDDEAFSKLVDNYLPTLLKVSPDAHYHVVGNAVKRIIYGMASESKRTGNEALVQAATILNQFIFGNSEFQPPTNLSKGEDDTIKKERQQFNRERFEAARDDLGSRLHNTLKATIDAHIDPKGLMTPYLKKTAVNEALKEIQGLVEGDKNFRSLLDKHWQNAFKTKFDKQSLDKIRSTYLSKAKSLLPTLIQKHRNEALKGIGKRTNETKDRKGPLAPGRTTTSKGAKTEVPKGMSTLEFLMQD